MHKCTYTKADTQTYFFTECYSLGMEQVAVKTVKRWDLQEDEGRSNMARVLKSHYN